MQGISRLRTCWLLCSIALGVWSNTKCEASVVICRYQLIERSKYEQLRFICYTAPCNSTTCTLMVDAKRSSSALVRIYQTTRHHIPVDLDLDTNRPGNSKSPSFLTLFFIVWVVFSLAPAVYVTRELRVKSRCPPRRLQSCSLLCPVMLISRSKWLRPPLASLHSPIFSIIVLVYADTVAAEPLLRSHNQVGAGLPTFCLGLATTSVRACAVALHGPPSVGWHSSPSQSCYSCD
jgi:hypothetical protein